MKKSKYKYPGKSAPKCHSGEGECMENNQTQTENSEYDLIFVRSFVSEEHRSETMTASPPIINHARITHPNLPKEGAPIESKEGPIHNMLRYDTANYQSNTFEQYEVKPGREKRISPSWNGGPLNNSHILNSVKGSGAKNNYENPAAKHATRFLGEENMEDNQRKVENTPSKPVLERPSKSKRNASDTLMVGPSTRSQTRKRCRNSQIWRESSWMESEDNTSDVVPSDDSDRVQITSFQQSESITQRKILACGLGARKSQCKPKNNDITGEMRFTFNDGNSSPQIDHELPSEHTYHDCSRKSQNEVEHQRPESTCVIPFSPEEDITDVLIEGPCIKDRITRSESPEVLIVGETTGSRPLPHTQDVRACHHVLSETQSHYRVDESSLGFNGHTGLQLGYDLSISDLQRTTSPTIEHISTENTDHNSQSTAVKPIQFVPVETDQEENTNTSSCPNQTGIEDSEIISVDQTANTSLDFTVAASPFGPSGYIKRGVFEILDDNCIAIQLEDFDSPSSENNRRVHSCESDISSSTRNSITNSLPFSNLRFNRHTLPTPVARDNTVVNNINSSASSQSEDTNDLLILPHTPSEARHGRHVTDPEFSDDSDSLPSLPRFTIFNHAHNNHHNGLTKQQINALQLRDFCKHDKLNQCSICITRYKQGSKIRILPCLHEYHHKCIDRWLSDNSTCPICRLHIISPADTEIRI